MGNSIKGLAQWLFRKLGVQKGLVIRRRYFYFSIKHLSYRTCVLAISNETVGLLSELTLTAA